MEKTSMRKIREIIRLYSENKLSFRSIAKVTGVSRPVISNYITCFEKSGIEYKNIISISDDQLFELLSCSKASESEKYKKLSENFPYYAKELKRKGVTIKKLWEEYIEDNPAGYSHSQFFRHYQNWRSSNELTMHMEHKAGDKMFVDFTGEHLEITDSATGTKKEIEIFVSILGASQFTYVEAVASQGKYNFIRACENALWYYGGVPRAIVPDCLKSAVTKGDKYEPDLNSSYQDFASYYGTTILPARPYHPKDKALVENAVRIVYSRIFASLRNMIFYSIHELNIAIFKELDSYNNRLMQKTKISRFTLFNDIEKKELKSLPLSLYEIKHFASLKVQFNYHVYLSKDKHYYSVPYRFIGKQVDVVYSDTGVEIYHGNIRIASHSRDFTINGYTTLKEHMPQEHRWVSEWNPERIKNWANKIGSNVSKIIEIILSGKEHPEQGYKVSLGIISLAKKYSPERLDKACERALYFQCYSMKSIKSILEKKLDMADEQTDLFDESRVSIHENIRGSDYYN